ncbi:MAG: type I-A CRISPR-associated protein Cas5a [Nitrososphaerota archaeon]
MTTLLVKVTFVPTNLFSIKRAESYQFASSYLLPPPSTLLGAFARGLFLLRGMPSPRNEEEAKAMIITATIRALTPLTRTGVVLKRMRTLELRDENEEESFKPRSDAMVREIVSLPKMEGYYLFNKKKVLESLGQEIESEIKRIFYSIDRLGDSESLVSVTSVVVNSVEAEKTSEKVEVNTVIEKDFTETVSGDYIYTIMPDLRDRSKPKGYYIPLSVDSKRTDVYYPSKFHVMPKENTFAVRAWDMSLVFAQDYQ